MAEEEKKEETTEEAPAEEAEEVKEEAPAEETKEETPAKEAEKDEEVEVSWDAPKTRINVASSRMMWSMRARPTSTKRWFGMAISSPRANPKTCRHSCGP